MRSGVTTQCGLKSHTCKKKRRNYIKCDIYYIYIILFPDRHSDTQCFHFLSIPFTPFTDPVLSDWLAGVVITASLNLAKSGTRGFLTCFCVAVQHPCITTSSFANLPLCTISKQMKVESLVPPLALMKSTMIPYEGIRDVYTCYINMDLPLSFNTSVLMDMPLMSIHSTKRRFPFLIQHI